MNVFGSFRNDHHVVTASERLAERQEGRRSNAQCAQRQIESARSRRLVSVASSVDDANVEIRSYGRRANSWQPEQLQYVRSNEAETRQRGSADLIRKINRVAIVSRRTAALVTHRRGGLTLVFMAMIAWRMRMTLFAMPAEVAVRGLLAAIGSRLRAVRMCMQRPRQLSGEVGKQQEGGEAVTEHQAFTGSAQLYGSKGLAATPRSIAHKAEFGNFSNCIDRFCWYRPVYVSFSLSAA